MTRDARSTCPTLPELDQGLLETGPSPTLARHLDACAKCRELVAEIVCNRAFLAELRGRLGPEVSVPFEAPPLRADLVPGYRLSRRIGRGGQGEVYEGVQVATRRKVAVKLVHVGDDDARSRRFEREVELAASLRHPGIVSVLHCERLADTRCALVMEYVDGAPIDVWAAGLHAASVDRPHRACLRTKLRTLSLVAETLQYAHAHGVVHRDLKPENILVQPDGAVRIVDFGVAKRAHDLAHATLTGGFSGTLAYAAPEQLSGTDDRVDVRTDLYSLGVVMYEVLAGRRPFDSHRPLDLVIRDVLSVNPPPLGRLAPGGVPAGANLEAVVTKALAKRPEARYQSAAAMQEELQRLIEGQPVSARLPGLLDTLVALSVRHRLASGLAALLFLLVGVTAVSMTWASLSLSSQRAQLSEALSVSNIARGRSESAAGNIARAERTLWPELISAGADPADAALLFEGSPRQLQAAWAVGELYTRVPSVLHQRVVPGSQPIRFEQQGEWLRIALPNGSERAVALNDGSWVIYDSRVPDANTLRVSSSGSHLIVSTPSADVLRSVAGALVACLDRGKIDGGRVWDVSSDGARMLLITPQTGLELWSVTPPSRVTVLAESGLTSNRPSFSRSGDRVFWGRDDGISAWTSCDGALVELWPIPVELIADAVVPVVREVRASADDRVLAAVFHSDVLLFDLRTKLLRTRLLPSHRGAAGGISMTPDGRRVVSHGGDQTVHVWDADSGAHLATFDHGGKLAGSIVLSDDGRCVAMCDESGFLRVVETAPVHWPQQIGAARNTVHRVRFSPDGRTIACASSDGSVYAWQLADPSCAWSSQGQSPLSALAFHPTGLRLAIADHSGRVDILDLQTTPVGRRTHFSDAPAMVTWLGYSPDGGLLVALTGESWCELIDGETGRPAGRLEGHAGRVIDAAFSRDGSKLYTVGADGELIASKIASREILFRTGPCGAITRAVAVSPDGHTIATGSDDRVIRLWDSTTGTVRGSITGCSQHIFELAYHPAGNVLFSCGRSPGVQVWDVRSARELAVLAGHADMVLSLALTPDGDHLVTTGADRRVFRWDLSMLRRAIRANAGPWLPPPESAPRPATNPPL